MNDKGSGASALRSTWRAISHRLAVFGGSLVGLMSLLYHVPVSAAALRGLSAYAGVLIVSRLGLWAFERARACDLAAQRRGKTSRS